MIAAKRIAVLTGDLVNSTGLGPAKITEAFKALEDCARIQADWHGAPLNFTRHRGDGWQVVLAKPAVALRSALTFRAALRAIGPEFDSYMGITEGEVTEAIETDLNMETTEVFQESGVALEHTKGEAFQKIYFHTEDVMDAVAVLADSISQDWTTAQAQAMQHALNPTERVNQTAVAKRLGKSRQAVAKALGAAKFEPLYLAISTVERA